MKLNLETYNFSLEEKQDFDKEFKMISSAICLASLRKQDAAPIKFNNVLLNQP